MTSYIVTITEQYQYKTVIDADNEQELDRILHEEVPLLIDMDKEKISAIKEDEQADMDYMDRYEWEYKS